MKSLFICFVAFLFVIVNGENVDHGSDRKLLTLRGQIQHDLSVHHHQHGWFKKKIVDKVKKNVVDPVKKNVIDPVVEYYTWGNADSRANLLEARIMMNIAFQIYYNSPRDTDGYTYLGKVSRNGAMAGLWRKSSTNTCVVSFRGSDFAWDDLLTNIQSVSSATTTVNGYTLNKSFYNYYNKIASDIASLMSSYTCHTKIMTGHSLGGAAAVAAQAAGLGSRSVTFGAPHIFKSGCNSSFRNNARRYFSSGGANLSLINFIPNSSYDPIPSLPSGFYHCAGTNVHLASYNDWDTKQKYRSEKVSEADPTTGANFVIHLASNYEAWFNGYF